MNLSDLARPFRILIIDDNPAIHEDIRKVLSGRAEPSSAFTDAKSRIFGQRAAAPRVAPFDIDSAFQGEEGFRKVQEAQAARRPYAMAFVDVRMPPGWDGIETIANLWEASPELQIVLCTAYSDYSWDEIFRKLRKPDSLVILKKPFDNIEVSQLVYALTAKWQLTLEKQQSLEALDQQVRRRTLELQTAVDLLRKESEDRTRAEEAVRQSDERFSKAFIASPIPLAIVSLRDDRFVEVNAGFQALTGFKKHELIGMTPLSLGIWENGPGRMEAGPGSDGVIRDLPVRLQSKSGETKEILLSSQLFDNDRESFRLLLALDLSEQQLLQRQFVQAQKMEAVGQLAAGLAHDFNNILQIIHGYSGMLLENECMGAKEQAQIHRIMDTATRAASLVRQLLAFSRKGSLQMQPMDLRNTVVATAEMVARLLPENIQISAPPAGSLPMVNADEAMIQQVLLNLAVNARDAMPEGGSLTLETRAVEAVNPGDFEPAGTSRGRFLCLSVADTGCGMAPEVLAHAFEPFFTTKEVGKGTGLGLSMVYGIAKQHGGWVEVESRPGWGTRFQVFLPVWKEEPEEPRPAAAPAAVVRGHETILVVEDEPELREFLVESLNAHGYQTCQAASGLEALDLGARHPGAIHLLLTDMVMPGDLNGQQLAERMLARDPALKVIYMSGYNSAGAGSFQNYRHFLAKPFSQEKMLEMIGRCLAEESWRLP
jgi:PAS domain S-box-containing protein